MKQIILLLSLFLFIVFHSAKAQFQYVSPMPGSTNLNVEHNIILREGSLMDSGSLRQQYFSIKGEKSGVHVFKMILSTDGKTVVLNPIVPFSYNETVTVTVASGLKTVSGKAVEPYSFSFQTHREYTAEEKENFKKAGAYIRQKELTPDASTDDAGSDTRDVAGMFTINTNTMPAPGNVFFSSFSGLYLPTPYMGYHIINSNGDSIYDKETDTIFNNFAMLQNGMFCIENGDKLRWDVLDSNFAMIDKYYPANGYEIDDHEFLLLPNGNAFMICNEYQTVDMTVYNANWSHNASVRGSVIQEFDSQHNLIFEWRSFDHVVVTEALHENLALAVIDYMHTNALEVDNDGNLLASHRHLDQITKINLSTGDFIWRLGGVNNQFTWINEPEPFTYQHDVRRLANGNITVFDNGNWHVPKHTAAKEYQLDEVNKTATLVWSYTHPNSNGGNYYYAAMGNVQRLSNGNTYINWGLRAYGQNSPGMTEVTSNGTIVWDATLEPTDNLIAYRSHKYVWDACSRITPSSMKSKNITNNSAKIIWNTAWGAVSYNVQYKPTSGNFTWSTINVAAPATSKKLTGLTANTQYKYRIQTVCSADGTKTSGYTDTKKFTTLPQKQIVANETPAEVLIYPNPAHDVVTIEGGTSISQVRVLNLLGQEMKRIVLDNTSSSVQTTFSLSGFPAGNYFVALKDHSGEHMLKLIVE